VVQLRTHHIKRSDFSNKLLQQQKIDIFKVLSNVTVWMLKDRVVDARLDIWFRSTGE
jgi:hypothetical protein